MANNSQESGKAPVATSSVSDQELSSALEAAIAEQEREETQAPSETSRQQQEGTELEGPPEEAAPETLAPQPAAAQKPAEAQPEEPEDPATRSRLGRKVKSMELEIMELKAQLAHARPPSRGEPATQTGEGEQAGGEMDDEVPEFITTPEELERYLSHRENKKLREQQGYQLGYARRFLEVGETDPLYEEIEREMMENFNSRATGDPKTDAELNYAKAKASVLSKKLQSPAPPQAPQPKPTLPGRGDNPRGSGVTFASRNARTAASPVVLDDISAEFVRRVGMSEESVKSALQGGASKPRR